MSDAITVGNLFESVGPRLQLEWVIKKGRGNPLRGDFPGAGNQALIGPLNCIHPNRVQVIGHSEMVYLTDMAESTYQDTIDKLFSGKPAAILVTDGIEPDEDLVRLSKKNTTPLLKTPLPDHLLINNLQYYLTHALAERITVHGVFMEVMGMGVLLTGDAAVGKSELALALLSRGHRLVADDVPEFAQVAPDILTGTCPPLLRDFLEVRGLGILNIRAMYGDSAILQKKDLHIILHMEQMTDDQLIKMDRLGGSHTTRDLLGVAVPQITVPVAPGRNLSILVEAAVQHHALRLKGYDASEDFEERQKRMLEEGS